MAEKMIEDCRREKRTQNIAADAEFDVVAEKSEGVDGRRVRNGSEWTVQKMTNDVDERAATAHTPKTVEDAEDADGTDGPERHGRLVTVTEGSRRRWKITEDEDGFGRCRRRGRSERSGRCMAHVQERRRMSKTLKMRKMRAARAEAQKDVEGTEGADGEEPEDAAGHDRDRYEELFPRPLVAGLPLAQRAAHDARAARLAAP
eukprot:gene12397-biopygen3884